MKHGVLPAILALSAILGSSCSFDFADGGTDIGESVSWTEKTARYYGTAGGAAFDVEVVKYYRNGVFNKQTESRIDADGLVYQVQRYNAAGALVSATAIKHEQTGLSDPAWRIRSVTEWAVEAGALVPESHTAYGYDSGNAVETKAVYPVSGTTAAANAGATPDWAARYALDSAIAPFYEAALWYGGDGAAYGLDAAQFFSWLPAADPADDHWNVSVDYRRETDSNRSVPPRPEPGITVPCTAKAAATDLGDVTSALSYFHAAQSLATVADPAYTVPALPDVSALNPASPAIPVSSFGLYAEVSATRNTEVTFDRDWYPVTMVRQDDRLPAPMKIIAEWDSQRRLTAKETYIGTTLALSVEIERDGEGYPTTIVTAGEGLPMPLTYALGYESGTHNLESVTFTVAGIRQTLTFLYGDALGVPVPALADARSLDPFAFMTGLLDNDLVIQHWNGESPAQLVEYFTVETAPTDTTVTVWDAHLTDDADSAAPDDTVNGTYELAWAHTGDPVASLTAKDDAGATVWTYEYAYGGALADAVAQALPSWLTVGASAAYDQLSALYSAASATGEGAMVQSIASGFLYDLLF